MSGRLLEGADIDEDNDGRFPHDSRAAVLESRASGFIYRSTDDTPAAQALTRWAREIVPAVREAIGK